MPNDSDIDDADEIAQFARLAKKATREGMTLARTFEGYRLDAPGLVVHRSDLDGAALFLKERPPLKAGSAGVA